MLRIIVVAVVLPFLLLACENNDGQSIDNNIRYGSDSQGDVAFSFIDITEVSVEITDTQIKINFGLLAIPETLTYDSINAPNDAEEYGWRVWFDLDDDSTVNNNIWINFSSHKNVGDVESEGVIEEFTDRSICLVDGVGLNCNHLGAFELVTENNTLKITIDKSIHEIFQEVDNQTKVSFVAIHQIGNTRYLDSYPDGDGNSYIELQLR